LEQITNKSLSDQINKDLQHLRFTEYLVKIVFTNKKMIQSIFLGQSFLFACGIAHWTYGKQKGNNYSHGE
jgi:hypothetical protein